MKKILLPILFGLLISPNSYAWEDDDDWCTTGRRLRGECEGGGAAYSSGSNWVYMPNSIRAGPHKRGVPKMIEKGCAESPDGGYDCGGGPFGFEIKE